MLPNALKTYQPDLQKAIDRSLDDLPVAQLTDESNYFITNKPPAYLVDIAATIARFVKFHHAVNPNKKIALVTSGGTTVPLENNTVRFIDNFSAGTRGSVSTEEFLDHGYAVIFLYRELSFLPYLRCFTTDPHRENFLDYVSRNTDSGTLEIKPEYSHQLSEVLEKYNYHKNKNNLLVVPFTTVNQYLYSLKLICEIVSKIYEKKTKQVVIYLAAAVSDFFIPESKLPTHKIQSDGAGAAENDDKASARSNKTAAATGPVPEGHIAATHNGGLTINLSPVPKFLSRIVDSWCPGALVISFKLETDAGILATKCITSLQRYNQGLVIGNLLQTRKYEVLFVYKKPSSKEDKTAKKSEDRYLQEWVRISQDSGEKIEAVFIPKVLEFHEKWIDSHKKT